MAFLVYSCMLCCDSLCLLSVWSDSSPQVYSLCQSLLAFWLCLERLIYLEGKCKKSIKLLSFSAWNIWNLSKPLPVSSGQIWPCAARAAGGASTWPCRRVRIEGRCPAFASGVGTQRMSVICICGAHSALMYMFVPLTLGASSKSESQCLCSQRQLLWHAMAIYVAYDSQRGTNHQLSTLLSLCACTCHSKSLVLAWTTPSSTTKSPIVGGILAPRKENLCLTRWSFSVYKQDFIKPSEAWWVCLASTRWARETWRCLWPLIYFGPQTFSSCCRCHCKALSIIMNPRRRGIKTLHCWTELPNCTKKAQGMHWQNRRWEQTWPRTKHLVVFIAPASSPRVNSTHVWTGRSYDIFRHTEAHTSNFLVEAW